MNKLLKRIALFSAPCVWLAFSGQVHAWTSRIDCEGGTVNALPANTSAAYWGTRTQLSTEQHNSGSQSCKFTIIGGTEGWSSSGGPLEWGMISQFPTPVSVGQEVWSRVSVFVPAGFQVVTNSAGMKFMRLHTRTATANTGCLDFWWRSESLLFWDPVAKKDSNAPMMLGFEGTSETTVMGATPADAMVKGTWETYETYVHVDSVSKNNGGVGEIRVWKNNKLIANFPQRISAVDKTGVIDSLYLFTYWNGNAPQTQSLYVDDVIITTDTPTNRDANGYPFIGGSVASSAPAPSAAPQSPPNFSVIKAN